MLIYVILILIYAVYLTHFYFSDRYLNFNYSFDLSDELTKLFSLLVYCYFVFTSSWQTKTYETSILLCWTSFNLDSYSFIDALCLFMTLESCLFRKETSAYSFCRLDYYKFSMLLTFNTYSTCLTEFEDYFYSLC